AHVLMIGDFFDLRIPFAVAAYVRKAVFSLWIGPPVGAHAHVIVLVAARRGYLLVHHGEWSIFHSAVGGIAEGCSQRTVWVRRISLLLFDQCFGIEQKNTGLSIRLWLLRMKWRQSQAQRCSQKIARSELFTSHASSHRACDLPADRLCGMGTASPA